MANEWTKVELYGENNGGDVRRYKILDGLAVSKGQLLSLHAGRYASTALGILATEPYCAGVAAEEHLAGEGVTDIAVWTNGLFNAVASDAVTHGEPLMMAASNKVFTKASASGAATTLGYAIADIALGATGNVRLRL